jgi:hypothetical protein
MVSKLLRALLGLEGGGHCRRCKEPLHPDDEFGASESVCLPCRLDPGRAMLSA